MTTSIQSLTESAERVEARLAALDEKRTKLAAKARRLRALIDEANTRELAQVLAEHKLSPEQLRTLIESAKGQAENDAGQGSA
jgi:hypothetical protein